MTNKILHYMIDIETQQRKRLSSLKKFDGLLLKEQKRSSGKAYYSSYRSKNKGKIRYKYIGDKTSDSVLRIKEVHHLKKSLAILGKNIELLKYVLRKLEEVDTAHINELLPAVYRASDFRAEMTPNRIAAEWKKQSEGYKASFPPFRPEELTVDTLDEKKVRSKSEGLIYNLFLSLGLNFVYELPLQTKIRTFYPDFTILSEIDYRSVYRIEHQGMMDDDVYSERFNNKVHDYLQAGYLPGLNIFFTFDSGDGGLDFEPILDIIHLKIRPPDQAGSAA